ncbi:protein NIF3 [Apiospora marii]|uniref:Protein NIF3 n=1 Tax=Apiospora marii TaxID=335849 RepID=A0ABR1S4N2_9PEZI
MAAPTFTDAVVKAMKTLYPPELADSAWDNTGLLLDQALLPEGAESKQGGGAVLLTNDLTAAVVDEALEKQVNIIISYHPVIFRAIKSLSNQDPMQKHLLRLIAARVAVYCPHTAVDAAKGGLNDWLCDIILASDIKADERKVVQPISRSPPESLQGLGYGRTMKLQGPMPLTTILKNLSRGLGDQQHMSVALPHPRKDLKDMTISSVSVCAGSGSSVLKDTDADLIVTGEMDHHSALRYTQLGQTVVTVFHSNSERQYLTQVLKPKLEQTLSQSSSADGKVLVSQADRDPFETIDISSLGS